MAAKNDVLAPDEPESEKENNSTGDGKKESTPGEATKKRRKLEQWSESESKKTLSAALDQLLPDSLTQRAAFQKLMPQLKPLREKGISFAQIAGLLGTLGFQLSSNTVRSYYSECLAKM